MNKPILAAFLSIADTTLSDDEKKLLETYNPFGIALFNRNLSSPQQVKNLTNKLYEVVGHDNIMIAADQEGGRVNRLKNIGFPYYAFQRTLGKIDNEEITSTHCQLIARDMLSLGINFNFAPVLDIEYPQTTMALKGRCFSNNPKLVAKHGKISVDTYLQSGICPCIKHLPAHGRAESDPHLGLPIIQTPLSELQDDFYPFKMLNYCPTAMTAHIIIPEIDNKNPITLSKRGINELIRQHIGFQGLLISDALEMRALKGSITQKAQAAWSAGCDIICYCMGNYSENENLCQNGKYLNDKQLETFFKIKKQLAGKKKLINIDNNQKRYYTLTSQFNDDDINYDATEVLHQIQQGEK